MAEKKKLPYGIEKGWLSEKGNNSVTIPRTVSYREIHHERAVATNASIQKLDHTN